MSCSSWQKLSLQISGIASFYSAPNHIQRRIHRQSANKLPVAGKDESARGGLRVVREAYVDQPDRLLIAAAPRTRDAGDAYAESRTCAFANSRGHRPGHLFAHGAVSFDQFLRHAQQIDFRVIRIADDAFEEIFRTAWHVSDSPGEQSAGATFSRRQRVAAPFERLADHLF